MKRGKKIMLEIFAGWKLWQIILTAVFGAVYLVFIVLDCRRKSKLKKLRREREQELKSCGYSDEQIKEILNSPKGLYNHKKLEEIKK